MVSIGAGIISAPSFLRSLLRLFSSSSCPWFDSSSSSFAPAPVSGGSPSCVVIVIVSKSQVWMVLIKCPFLLESNRFHAQLQWVWVLSVKMRLCMCRERKRECQCRGSPYPGVTLPHLPSRGPPPSGATTSPEWEVIYTAFSPLFFVFDLSHVVCLLWVALFIWYLNYHFCFLFELVHNLDLSLQSKNRQQHIRVTVGRKKITKPGDGG